jgi:Domain of unknown function (DUF4432)
MPHTSMHTFGCRVSDEWTLRGMRAAILENELLRVLVLLDKGAEIIEFRYKPLDLDPLLRMPGELRNPAHGQPSIAGASGGFLDYYAGGWQEILPNGGPPASYQGADYGQHGEICLVPWSCEIIDDGPEQVSIRCSVRALRSPVLLQRTMTIERGRATLQLDERLTNEANQPLDMMWGHHIAFGLPFLQEGAWIDTSARQLLAHEQSEAFEPRRIQPGQLVAWPHALAGDGTPLDMSHVPARTQASGREMAYLTDFDGPAWYALTNPSQRAGFALRWDSSVFRYLWLWQEFGATGGYPWWRRTHTMALERWTSYPTLGLPTAIERGTQLTLQPGQTIITRLVATAFSGVNRVGAVEADGAVVAATKS